MRTETSYYCEICGKRHWEAEDALACEEAHKVTNHKPKYNKGDLLHYIAPEDAVGVYYILEDMHDVYWDAQLQSWVYKYWGDKIPEDDIELEMTAEERTQHIDAIKAKLEPDYHSISVTIDATAPRFSISAYWKNRKV